MRTLKTKTFAMFLGLLALANAQAQRLSPLESAPDWTRLDRFQQTITHDEFVRLLNEIFAPDGGWRNVIEVSQTSARIAKTLQPRTEYVLRFGQAPPPRYWQRVADLGPAPARSPLAGLHIGIDPGHIGGKWARVEERWFQIDGRKPVTEGDMTLLVARKIQQRLEALGAKVSLVRDSAAPVTRTRPGDLRRPAIAELRRRGVTAIRESYSNPNDPTRNRSVQWQSEILFYRASEIRVRAQRVNDVIRPDLVLCLHFNAEAWGNPDAPTLVPQNHLHLLVNGCYLAEELEFDDVRFGMVEQLLSRTARESITLSDSVARSMAEQTGLPPYVYKGRNAARVGASGYVWARNLLANRLYLCPVLYLEPYVMNNIDVFERIQMGDYEGTQPVGGRPRKSIFNEYADSVLDGLLRHVSEHRGR